MGGGYTVDASQYIHEPDTKLTEALMAMQLQGGKPLLEQQNRILDYAANMPMESWTPDIFTPGVGAMDTAAQVAAINAFKSAELEAKTNPNAQAMRSALPAMLNEDLTGKGLQKQMDDWTSRHGIAKLLGSGMQDSTIGKSALFDAATQEGAALRRANEQAAAAYLSANQAPVAGIDPASANAALQGAGAMGAQQRNARAQQMLGNVQANAQSTTDWVNQMMNSTSNAVAANQANWQNYNQAMLNAATGQAASKNASQAGMIGAAGSAVGVAVAAAL